MFSCLISTFSLSIYRRTISPTISDVEGVFFCIVQALSNDDEYF